jgi:hypothetical protein
LLHCKLSEMRHKNGQGIDFNLAVIPSPPQAGEESYSMEREIR